MRLAIYTLLGVSVMMSGYQFLEGFFDVSNGLPGLTEVKPVNSSEDKEASNMASHIQIPFDSERDLERLEVHSGDQVSFVEDDFSHPVMRVDVPKDGHYGTQMNYVFDKGYDEVHTSWQVYLPEGWTTARSHHMKFPGIAHTDKHGWGGRKTDGTGGWSARTGFRDQGDSVTGEFYVYHMDMGRWGSSYKWEGTIPREEWVEIENYVRVNTPGEADGVIKAWVNGDLVYEKSDLRFRAAGFEQYSAKEMSWVIYHGGTPPSPVDQHLYLRNLELWLDGKP